MAEKLFGSTDRDAVHAELATVLAAGQYPQAECREDPNDLLEPFTVWTGPRDAVVQPVVEVSAPDNLSESDMATLSNEVAAKIDLDALADKIAARLQS